MIAEGCDHGDVDREKGRIMSQHDFCVGHVDDILQISMGNRSA